MKFSKDKLTLNKNSKIYKAHNLQHTKSQNAYIKVGKKIAGKEFHT